MQLQVTHAAFAALLVGLSGPAFAATMSAPMKQPMSAQTIMVGRAPMYPSRNIVQNAVHSKDHTTLVALVKDAGLVKALEGPGPFTVFAPTNEAIADLPPATVRDLQKPANKAELVKILEYHVVPGDYDTLKIRSMILAGGGHATLKTLEGGTLALMMNGSSNIQVEDEKGDIADITIADVRQSNGVIQVIDHVLMP
ncbi:MAG: fasciclin domain-containing protein [Acetobacteraceae bacterium]